MKKTDPTPRRADREAAARAHGEDLRSWMRVRQSVAARATTAGEVLAGKSRRLFARRPKSPVQAELEGPQRSYTWFVQHQGPNRAERRARARRHGIALQRSVNEPYRNPGRPVKLWRAGTLRHELRP